MLTFALIIKLILLAICLVYDNASMITSKARKERFPFLVLILNVCVLVQAEVCSTYTSVIAVGCLAIKQNGAQNHDKVDLPRFCRLL